MQRMLRSVELFEFAVSDCVFLVAESLVPSPADIQSKGYSQRFPVYASDEPLDAKHHTWPWGQLTKRGFQQTAAVGSLLVR